MKKIIILFCALACLVACHDDDEATEWTAPAKAGRSVMVYMSGENNLTVYKGDRYLQNDLAEIVEGSKYLGDNDRLFVFVDSLGTKKDEKGKPYIIEVHGGKIFKRVEYTEDFYACDPAKFREVISWMTANAAADSYGLVLWGHACGWAVSADTIASANSRMAHTRAYGEDDGRDASSGSGAKWMNITQMAKALEGLPKFEFVFADCCNMMCAEVGYELRNVTKLLIGSPGEIPGDGAPYQLVVPCLFKNGSDLYRSIIDKYYDYYLEDYKDDAALKGYSVPLSVIDTQYLDELAKATNDVLGTFFPQKPGMPITNGVVYYWYYDSAPVMYDMKAFIKKNADSDAYSRWEAAFNRAVPYHRMSLKWMTIYNSLEVAFYDFIKLDESLSGCVSMFVPLSTINYDWGTFRFNGTFKNMGWNNQLGWERFGW